MSLWDSQPLGYALAVYDINTDRTSAYRSREDWQAGRLVTVQRCAVIDTIRANGVAWVKLDG